MHSAAFANVSKTDWRRAQSFTCNSAGMPASLKRSRTYSFELDIRFLMLTIAEHRKIILLGLYLFKNRVQDSGLAAVFRKICAAVRSMCFVSVAVKRKTHTL